MCCEEQLKECEELGILEHKDEQGTVLQIFTKPVGDRYVLTDLEFIYYVLHT